MNKFPRGVRCGRSRLLLVICPALLAACAPSPRPSGSPAADGAVACASAAPVAEYAHALLRIRCDGGLMAGRATWSAEGSEVTLEFPPGSEGPVGAELVKTWPLLSEPPWLGHTVLSVTVVERGGIQVRFGALADEPALLFADPRLSGSPAPTPVEGDARDAIDDGSAEVVTHHAASIDYARSLGREVRPAGFDRLYLIAFAGTAGAGPTGELSASLARDWVDWGGPGARRLSVHDWAALVERCGARRQGLPAGEVAAGDAPGSDPAGAGRDLPVPSRERATVAYVEGDLPGRQAAERLVSAGMRGGAEADMLASLTGAAGRLGVRGVAEAPPARGPSDVAAVLRVHAGPGHPCSLHAEVVRAASTWKSAGDPGAPPGVILLGELAAFAVERPGVRP